MPVDLKAIQRIYDRGTSERRNWDTLWQEIADYMVPWRNRINTIVTPGTKLTDRIFDSTAPQALVLASSAIQGSVTPSTLRWFSFTTTEPDLLDLPGVATWLDDLSNRVFGAISNSNFDSEAQEIYSDLLAFGVGAMIVEQDEDKPGLRFPGVVFHTQQPGTFVIQEGANGRVNTVMREVAMTASAVASRWGIDTVSDSLKKLLEAGHSDAMVSILHAVYPREDWLPEVQAPSRMRYADVWMEAPSTATTAVLSTVNNAPGASLHLLQEAGHPDMPIPCPRWRKMSGETYGRSPGMTVLPDVRTLNQAVELRLKAWVLAIAPPIITQDRGVIGNVRLEPFGRTYVRPGAVIQTLDIPSRFDVANFQEELLRGSIKEGFFVDLLNFQQKPGTPISATEASIRFQTMQRILGPVVSRLQAEFLVPVVSRVFRIMLEAGALPEPPGDIRGASLELVFEGPLARVQRSGDVESINQFFALLFPLMEVSRRPLKRIDFDEVIETLSDATSLPARILRSRDAADVDEERERQEAAAQQQQANLLQAAEVLQGAPGATNGATPGL